MRHSRVEIHLSRKLSRHNRISPVAVSPLDRNCYDQRERLRYNSTPYSAPFQINCSFRLFIERVQSIACYSGYQLVSVSSKFVEF